jgi:hypothetical protein
VEGVRAALGQDVDDAAGRPAELRRVARRLDLDFFDEIGEEVLARETADDVGRLDAVDDVAILGGGRAVDHDARRLGLVVDTRRLRDERREITRVREQGDLLGAQVRRLAARLHVDDRRFGRDRDVLADGRKLQVELDALDRAELDLDIADLRRFEPRDVRADFVETREYRREAEVAALVRGRGQDAAAARAGFDGHPGQDTARRVLHDAFD